MFVLYPFLFVAFYRLCKKLNPGPVGLWKKMREITKNGGDGPIDPNDDMPYRIMPHVVSCISYDIIDPAEPLPESDEELPPPLGIPELKTDSNPFTGVVQDLPLRRNLKVPESHQGCDGRPTVEENINSNLEYVDLLKNMKKIELIENLKSPKISESNKLEMLNLFDRTHGPAHLPYKENIFGAGLMKDWDFEWDEGI